MKDSPLAAVRHALREIPRRRDLWIPALFAAAGFTPIACLTADIFEILPLHVTSVALALPAYLTAIAVGARHPRYGRRAAAGFVIALAGVLLYDATRVPWIVSGLWLDFIPKVGAMLLGTHEPDAIVGYAWRWVGNGGGMGVAFFMMFPLVSRSRDVRGAGLVYGVGIWACLILTLLLAPRGQEVMFRLTPMTFVLSLVGHLVFGGVIGVLMHWTKLNVTPYEPDELPDAGLEAATTYMQT